MSVDFRPEDVAVSREEVSTCERRLSALQGRWNEVVGEEAGSWEEINRCVSSEIVKVGVMNR